MTAAENKHVCPRCKSEETQPIQHKGQLYLQCAVCGFWSTKPNAFIPPLRAAPPKDVSHGR